MQVFLESNPHPSYTHRAWKAIVLSLWHQYLGTVDDCYLIYTLAQARKEKEETPISRLLNGPWRIISVARRVAKYTLRIFSPSSASSCASVIFFCLFRRIHDDRLMHDSRRKYLYYEWWLLWWLNVASPLAWLISLTLPRRVIYIDGVCWGLMRISWIVACC